jgi:kynureninase
MTLQLAQEFDLIDPLAKKRAEFLLPRDTIYLDGNSLGPLPKVAKTRVEEVVGKQWGEDLIASWNKNNWISLPATVGDKIAPLIGAAQGQVVCCDSISINLFKLLAAALNLQSTRKIVLSQTDNFPTDLYAAQGLSSLLGETQCQLKLVDVKSIVESLDESIAVLLLTHVNFRGGEKHDMALITKLAHAKGILVIWDLAHSAGAMPLQLDAAKVDFAVGCGYKYFNGGPGAPAFIYVAARHQSKVKQPLAGWMGDQSPFDFNSQYKAAPGINKFLSGTPNIISMAALDAALDVFCDVDLEQLWQKSMKLSELFRQTVSQHNGLDALLLISPNDPEQRGSQLAYSHPDAFAISQALIDHKVIVDFRAPNILRFGFTPLYTRFIDVSRAAQILEEIFTKKIYQHKQYQAKQQVT